MSESEASPPDLLRPNPKIGVFVCSCGKNIGAVVDVKAVTEEAAKIPGVVHAEWNRYTCSEAGQRSIQEAVKSKGLDRFIVAACSPRLHGETFSRCASSCG